MKKIFLPILFLLSSTLFAQDNENFYGDYIDDNVIDFIYTSRPMIEVNYGIGSPNNKNVIGEFSSVGSWDIKLGKSELKNYDKILVDLSERYLFLSYLSSSTQNYSSTVNKILTDSYRFGFGTRDGIGYGGKTLSFVPYISQDFVWTKLSEYSNATAIDETVLDDYLGAFRFGDRASYGLKMEIASMVQVNAFYETSVIYRRHLFWYWSGSFIVSQIGYNILSYFTDDIVDSSPILGPIFNFALKAGYLYGYHLLRQENMNWPFNSSGNEAPLTFETFNVGVSFVF